jgi:2',3'-cyclic-nucleotide 2'-phosphodiesterase (5'-nucleotidase family)
MKMLMNRKIIIVAALLIASVVLTYRQISTNSPNAQKDQVRTITIFYTSDEHGYLEPTRDSSKTYGGAANVMAALKEHGYHLDSDNSILLSGGDIWAGGPAISHWFEGRSTIQVTNAMGYDTATIGNHEFDYGQDILQKNIKAAEFPFLSANLLVTETGKPPDYCQPYVIREVNGVLVAIIGLTTRKTSSIVIPSNISDLSFTDYEEALRRVVPKAIAEGAQLPIVIAHICTSELRNLIPVASELSIPLLAGGHCHQLENIEQEGVRIIGPGAHWKAFAKVDITFDTATGETLNTKAELVSIEHPLGENPRTPDPAIEAIVDQWSEKMPEALEEAVGYTETGIQRGWPLFNLLMDSWLWAYPDADIAISNFGGFREAFPPGEITRADIMATWPFKNEIISVELTGKQILENLLCCGGTVGGLTYRRSGEQVKATLKDGHALDPEATYRVLVNNYIYERGDNYLFKAQNPNGFNLGVRIEEPVIKWIQSQKTSPQRPLEIMLDGTERGELPPNLN